MWSSMYTCGAYCNHHPSNASTAFTCFAGVAENLWEEGYIPEALI